VIEGIEVKGAYQFGVWVSESDVVTLRRTPRRSAAFERCLHACGVSIVEC
jgi:hypothetical protein